MPVNLGLAHTSDRLLFLAVVLYALSMLGYASEFAFGRTARHAADAIDEEVARVQVPADVSELALVAPATGHRAARREAPAATSAGSRSR